MSITLECDVARPAADVIDRIVEALDDGLAVVLPTETQYGLALRADRPDSPERIDKIKKRRDQSAALFVKDLAQAEAFCRVDRKAEKLAQRFLPGPLTLVLPAKDGQKVIADGFASELGFGIRISSAPLIGTVMKRTDYPVTATSANISGRITSTSIATIRDELGEDIDLFIDGGPHACRSRVPSTVVALGENIRILRPGLITETEILEALAS